MLFAKPLRILRSDRQNLQCLAVRKDGGMICAFHVRQPEADGLLSVILKKRGRLAAPARVLLDKLSRMRVRPVDQLIDGGNIAVRVDIFAAVVTMPVYPEWVRVWGGRGFRISADYLNGSRFSAEPAGELLAREEG